MNAIIKKRGRPHGSTKHGKIHTPTYKTWSWMKSRCNNPKDDSYKNYGGRGIRVCKRWENFENFLADMGDKPPGTSIDRINNNGNYGPKNCRWATKKEQDNNRRGNFLVTYQGKTQTLQQWADEYGLGRMTLKARIIHNWPLGKALTTPPKRYRK